MRMLELMHVAIDWEVGSVAVLSKLPLLSAAAIDWEVGSVAVLSRLPLPSADSGV